MKIDHLLAKYFDGETTREEEQELKRLFRNEDVPVEFEVYRPFFAFFEEEAKSKSVIIDEKRKTLQANKPNAINLKRRIIYVAGGVAATILLVVGGLRVNMLFGDSTDYVIIDGHKSADIHLAREQALAAFRDVSFSREEIFDTLFNE